MDLKHTTAIILAAGQGKRMNHTKNKQFIEVFNVPVIVYTLQTFINHPSITDIILVVSNDDYDAMKQLIIDYYFAQKSKISLVVGGNERYDSVYNALKIVDARCKYVLVHDGARPLVTSEKINDILEELTISQACILAVKAKDTFKLVDQSKQVSTTLARDLLYTVQTPQGFCRNVIIEAYDKGIQSPKGITDDSMMVELFTEYKVKVVEGDYTNIKITTPDDIHLMEKIILNKNKKL